MFNNLIILIAVIKLYFRLPYHKTKVLVTMLLGKLEINVPHESLIEKIFLEKKSK